MQPFSFYALLMYNRLINHISIDSRALSLMRIAIGLVLICDIILRLPFAQAFYGPNGIYPTKDFYVQSAWFNQLSFHLLGGEALQYALLVMHLFIAVLLLLGIQTRWATVICWVLLVSSHNRNPFILQGGDDLLRLVLFWCIFLPWGRHFNYKKQEKPIAINGMAAWALILQVLSVYFYSAMMKGPEWHTHFSAVWFAYQLDSITYPLATYLLNFPQLLKVLTLLAFLFELLIPLVAIVFFPNPPTRIFAFVSIVAFHLWNASTLLIGIFPWVGIACALVLLPPTIFIRKQTNPEITSSLNQPASLIVQVLFLAGIVYTQIWNLNNTAVLPYKMTNEIAFAGNLFRLDQSWGMFAPGVLKDDGWFVLKAGDQDLIHNRRLINITENPSKRSDLFANDRWRKLGENISQPRFYFLQKPFCRYALNTLYPSNADSATLYFINNLTTTKGTNQPLEIELCSCSAMAAHP